MNNTLPPIDDFIDDEITEADFKVALTRLHAYLTEAVGANGENITAAVTVTNTGSGNAVTAVSANGSAITVTKGNSFVPATRTIAGKPLSADITLEVEDIGIVGVVSRDNGSLAVGSYVLGEFFKAGTNVKWPNGAAYPSYTTSDNTHWTLSPVTIGQKRSSSSYEKDSFGNPVSGTWRNVSGKEIATDEIGLFQRIA